MIAALYIERGGGYWNLPNVDAWDEARDARLYDGPHPIVAHPPFRDLLLSIAATAHQKGLT